MIAVLFIMSAGSIAPALGAGPATMHLTDESQTYDLIGRADVLDDPSGNLDVDDVARSRDFHSSAAHPQPPAGGVRWYRVRTSIPAASAGRWYLVADNTCDDADLYAPHPGGFTHAAFGYRIPFAQRPSPGLLPATLVPQTDGPLFVRLQCRKSDQQLLFQSAASLGATAFDRTPRYPALMLALALAVVALGLALVTRSRLYAFASLTALAGAANNAAHSIDRWLPNASLPFYLAIYETSNAVMLVVQLLFYEQFFQLDTTHARRSRRTLALRAGAVVCLIVGFAQYVFVPAQFYATHAWIGPSSDLLDAVQGLWYLGVAALAVTYARAGNRSAWFVAVGAFGFGLASYVTDVRDFFPAFPAWTAWTWLFSFPFDITLFILGVGDQLRQTALSRQRVLQERDDAQSSLVAQQRDHIVDVERRNHAFARFVPSEFLAHLGRGDLTDVALGDHIERSMAVLFTDVRGFTEMSERLSSEATFTVLNAYFARAGPVIRANGGFIDKYVGDAIVALFPNRPSDALDAAIAVQGEVRRFNEERARRGEEPIAVGIGVNYGSMLLGTVGESERYETTVIADSVNVASRLEGLTKVFGVSIIIGGALVDALDDGHAYSLRPLGAVEIRGHQRAERAYELFDGDPHEVMLQKRHTLADFTAAVAEFSNGAYAESRARFGGIVEASPSDRAATYFRDRSAALQNGGTLSDAPSTTA